MQGQELFQYSNKNRINYSTRIIIIIITQFGFENMNHSVQPDLEQCH